MISTPCCVYGETKIIQRQWRFIPECSIGVKHFVVESLYIHSVTNTELLMGIICKGEISDGYKNKWILWTSNIEEAFL